MAKIEYLIDGKPMTVDPENEKAFLEAMKGKKIEKVSKKEDDKEKSGNQEALQGDATVEQTSNASNQEADQPQNNQQKNTESNSENTSSESPSSEPILQIGATGSYYADSSGNIIPKENLTDQQNKDIKDQDSRLTELSDVLKETYYYQGQEFKVHPDHVDDFLESHEGARTQKEFDVDNLSLPTQDQYSKVHKDAWWSYKEKEVVDWLNNKTTYSTMPDVRFEQARRGVDAVEVLMLGQESGEGKVFNIPSVINKMTRKDGHIKNSQDQRKNVMDEINHYVKSQLSNAYKDKINNEIANNFMDVETSMIDKTKDGRGQAQIAQNLDKKSGYKRTVTLEDGTEVDLIAGEGGKYVNPGSTNHVMDKEDYRFFHDQNVPVGAPLIKWSGLDSFTHADTEGFITLENGTKLSYDYLLENIEDIRDVHERNITSTSKKNEGKKRLDEGKGKTEDEALYNHVSENIDPYFMLGPSGQEDINIVKINETIEELSKEDGNEEKIKELEARKMSIIKERGYDKMELYDPETGMFLGHEKIWEEDESGRFWVNPNTGQKILKLGDENKSQELADETDLDELKEEFINSYIEVLEFAKIAGGDSSRMTKAQNAIWRNLGEWIDTNNDSWGNDVRQLKRVIETGDIFNLSGGVDLEYLTKLPEDTYIGQRFNQALDNMVTYGRAIKLNINPTKSKQESWGSEAFNSFQEALTGEHFGSRGTEDEALEVFESYLSAKGYEMPEYKTDDWWSRERGASVREFADAVTSGGAQLTPILASIYIGNKVTGMHKGAKLLQKTVAQLTKNSPAVVKWGAPIITSGFTAYGEWAVGEHIGEQIFGSDGGKIWKAHTLYRDVDGELHNNWILPFTVGMGTPIWSQFTKGISNRIINSNTRAGRGYARALNMTPETVKVLQNKVGGGGTAAMLLGFGEMFDSGANPFSEQGVDTFLETWALMSMVGFGKLGVPKEVYNAMKTDVLSLNSRSIKADNAMKTLGFVKDGMGSMFSKAKGQKKDGQINENKIDSKVKSETKKIDKQIEKIEKDSKMSVEEKGQKITELESKREVINEAGITLKRRNLILHAKKVAISKNKYNEFLRQQYVDRNIFDKLAAGTLSAKEVELVGQLTPESLYHIFNMKGIKQGSPEAAYFEHVVKATSVLVAELNKKGITEGSPLRKKYIENSLEGILNLHRIDVLQDAIKQDPSKKQKHNAEIKKLKQKNKELGEGIEVESKKFDANFKKLMDAELASAAIQAKKLDLGFEIVGQKKYDKALIDADKYTESNRKSAGFIVGNKIYINRKNALAQRNLGVGIHEVVHGLLKNSLKGKDGKISKEGIKLIDGMMAKLSTKDQKIIQERIDEEYRYDANGKEKKQNEYYEEYITVLGDAIKNKQIKRDYKVGRRLARVFYPLLKKQFPQLYKFNLGGTKGKDAVNDLYDMVQEIQSDGLTRDVLASVKKDNAGATFSMSRGMMETLDHFNSKKKNGRIEFGLDKRAVKKFKNNEEYRNSLDGFWKAHEILSSEYRISEDPNVKKGIKDLENIIMGPDPVKRYVESGANNYTRESFVEAVKLNLTKRFENNYNYNDNPSLFGWLYSKSPQGLTIMEHARGDAGMAKGGKEQVKTVSYDVKMAGGEKTFAETMADKTNQYDIVDGEQILGGAVSSKQTASLRKKIGIQRNSDLVKKTLNTLEKTFKKGEDLGDISNPKFRGIVEQHMINELRKPVQDAMGYGTGIEYQNFLLHGTTFKGIFDAFTPHELQSFEKQAKSKGGKRILTELDYKTGDAGKIRALIKANLLPAAAIDKAAQGVNVYKKKPLKFNDNGTMPAELRKDIEALFIKINSDVAVERLGYKLSQNTPSTRKEGLAKKIVSRFSQDATSEVINRMKRKGEIPEFLNQETLSDALAVIHRQMNSIPMEAGGAKFAKGENKVLFNLLKGKLKDVESFLKKDGIIDLMYKDMELYDIIERHVEAVYGPVEFKNEGFIKKAKELIPKIFEDVSSSKDKKRVNDILNKKSIEFWKFRKIKTIDGVKTKVFDTKIMKEQTELYTKKMLDFLPKSELIRQQGLVQNLQILKNSLFKLQSDRTANADGTLKGRKDLNKEYDKLIKKAGSKMTPHTKKLWEEAIKVIEHLDLAESTVQTQESVNRAVQDIMSMKGLSRAEKIGAATTAFNPKSIDAARKFYKAYASSIQDWVNTMESSKTMTREQAMQHVFIDFYTNSNFTKGTRMLAPVTMMYVGRMKGKKKGEHLKDRANVDAELLKSIYEGNVLKDFNTIMEGYEQAIGPKKVFDILDNLGGANNLNKAYRLMLDPKIAKDMIDLATGRDMYSILIERHALDLVKSQLKSYERSNAVTSSVKAKKQITNFALSKGKEKRGMSTFDFDDTLAKTKSGVRTTIPVTDGIPRPGRKVIFLAGGAGSGKGNVVKKLGLEKDGFKIVNQDISLEWLKKNNGLPENMNELTKEQRSTLGKLGHQARGIARRKMMKYQGNADGVVIDGTGGSTKSMEKLVKEFKDKGYDVSMLFVETSVKTALERNAARKERSLLNKIVERNHEAVQKNKPTFKDMFGERFMEVNTDKLKQEDAMPLELVTKMHDFVRGYEKLRLDAEQFAVQGDAILKRGGKFDFSEFNKVVEGEQGPLFGKALERAKKFGTKDMFVLTARPAESAKAIHEFLKSQGLEIPLKNITGLANSTGEAKARWMLEKFAEGYNDMYFADDALQNVKAVKDVLKQLDIKSKVVQAKIQFSKGIDRSVNEIFERASKGKFKADKDMSLAEARLLGKSKGRFDYFVPPSAEDLKGLIYKMLGRGRQGDADMKFFKEALFDPFARGIRDLTIVKQNMSSEYFDLKKKAKDVKLTEKIGDTPYTVDAAIRMYLWNKAGYEVPGITKAEQKQLIDHVNSRPNLVSFAESLGSISRIKEGYEKPGDYWMVESIAADLNNITLNRARKDFLHEWIENKKVLFSEKNMNKIEALYGRSYRNALENILTRMEKGTNRLHGVESGPTKLWMDWINGSVGATMFWNTRSAVLQTISVVNFTNFADNNIFAQAKAFANQPQFWKDFAFIMNSPMLKQRRAGLEIDVTASELSNRFRESGKDPRSILKYLLEKGFAPTRIADSFAIAMGGAPFYRNRLNKYIKQGMSKKKAEEQAWLDFQERAEETQQSSRPDLISGQQAGPLGRLILAWQNTPMQMTRLMKKSLSDIVNRRRIEDQSQIQSDISNLSRILYYGAIQNVWFGTLQSGLAWLMFGGDAEDKFDEKSGKVLNGAFDTLLRGTGVYGAALSTLKNTYLRYNKEKNTERWKQDFGNVVVEALQISPPIGSKARKVYSAINSYNKFDAKGVSKEIGWRIENPELHAMANLTEALTNIPVSRLVNKANNLEEAITGNHELWQRIAMIGGWSRWNVGAKDEELEEAKGRAKETKSERNKEAKKEDKEKQGLKQVRCSGTKSSGGRCGNTTWTDKKSWKCAHHMAFKDGMDRDGDGIKEYQCKATTSSGRRCRNKTENKNKRCYAHQ